ncbi:MAG: MFS transporter [Clostridiaceae bacterium]
MLKSSSPDTPRQKAPALLPVFSLLMFVVGYEMGGFQLALRGISDSFSLSASGAGLLAAAQYVSIIFMPLLFGALSDRAGKKRIIVSFALVFLLGCALTAASRGVVSFAFGVFFIGAGFSVCESAGSAALSDASPESGDRWINLSQGALSLGAVLSPVFTQFGMERFGWSWRSVFLLCGAGALALVLPLALAKYQKAPQPANQASRRLSFSFFASGIFLLLFCAILLYVGLENGIGYFTESLFALQLGSARFGAYALSAYWASMALSRILFGVLPLSPQKTLPLCLGISSVLFLALALSGSAALSLAACALIGFAFGPVWPMLMNRAARAFPQSSGGAIGLMSAGCGIGGALFPFLMGLVSDTLSLPAAFGMLALFAFAAMLLSYFALKKAARAKQF